MASGWVQLSSAPDCGKAFPVVTPDGSVYLFGDTYYWKWSGSAWVQTEHGITFAEYTPSPRAVAVDDDTIVVAAPQGDAPASLKVYVYHIAADTYETLTRSHGGAPVTRCLVCLHPDEDKVVVVHGYTYGNWYEVVHVDESPHFEIEGTLPFALEWMGNQILPWLSTLDENVYCFSPQSGVYRLKADLSGWDFVRSGQGPSSFFMGTGSTNFAARPNHVLTSAMPGSAYRCEAAADYVRNNDSTYGYHGTANNVAQPYRLNFSFQGAPTTVEYFVAKPLPQITWVSGYSGQVNVSWTYSDPEGYAQQRYQVQLSQGAVVKYDTGEVTSATTTHLFTGVAAGTYDVTLWVWNAAGVKSDADTDEVTVTGDPGPGEDVELPVVEVTAPADGAEVSGNVRVVATATDNVGVTSVVMYVDGQAQGTLTEPNYGSAYRWAWDSSPWANGEHTVQVKAWDAANNMGSDSITVDLQNSLAASQVKITTNPLTVANGRVADLGIEILDVDPPPLNPAQVYNVRAYCGPGSSVDLADYFPVEVHRSHGFPAEWEAVRWIIIADPAEVLSYWETGATSIVALCGYPGDLVAVLTDGPSLVSFDGSSLTELLDLSDWGTTPRDVCHVDGKLLVALDDRVVAHDLDAGEAVLDIGLPGVTAVRAIEPRGSSGAWIAGDIAGGGRLFSFSYPSPAAVGDVEQILSLEAYGSPVAIGCAGGKVYVSYGSAPALAYATGENAVWSLHDLSGQVLAGTSSDGVVYRAQPAWAQDAELPFSSVSALGQYLGKAYAGGNDAELWRRDAADTWVEDRTLDETTAINALLEHTDASGATSLLIGTSGTDARLYRLELSPGSRIQSGVEPPDIVCKLLRTVVSDG